MNWVRAASSHQRWRIGTSYKLAPAVVVGTSCKLAPALNGYELQARTSGEWVRATSSHQRRMGTSCKFAPAGGGTIYLHLFLKQHLYHHNSFLHYYISIPKHSLRNHSLQDFDVYSAVSLQIPKETK